MVIQVVEQHLQDLREVCLRHGVTRLELFGSAADTAAFDPDRSDIDFIVRFPRDFDLGPWLARYFDLRDDLQRVLGRPVDLVMEGAIRDGLFAHEAARTRRLIYADQNTEAA